MEVLKEENKWPYEHKTPKTENKIRINNKKVKRKCTVNGKGILSDSKEEN